MTGHLCSTRALLFQDSYVPRDRLPKEGCQLGPGIPARRFPTEVRYPRWPVRPETIKRKIATKVRNDNGQPCTRSLDQLHRRKRELERTGRKDSSTTQHLVSQKSLDLFEYRKRERGANKRAAHLLEMRTFECHPENELSSYLWELVSQPSSRAGEYEHRSKRVKQKCISSRPLSRRFTIRPPNLNGFGTNLSRLTLPLDFAVFKGDLSSFSHPIRDGRFIRSFILVE